MFAGSGADFVIYGRCIREILLDIYGLRPAASRRLDSSAAPPARERKISRNINLLSGKTIQAPSNLFQKP